MILNEIFEKPVQRQIEGVIKAEDAEHLGMEVEEYVLTNEAQKEVERLLEDYTTTTSSNGVWISGFFGSGKSHMLKMLAHLLGDVDGQEFSREKVSEAFRSKAEGAFLPGLIGKADKIAATSLLFNIANKATVISKDQADGLLKVFVRIFDEFCGYFGTQGHVARFEREMDDIGKYDDFKAAYQKITSKVWVEDRKNYLIQGRNVDKAFAEVVGGDAPDDLLKKYSDQYNVSIDEFTDQVVAWLDLNAGARLNFFVDEVGQFIADDTKQMLNLQTVVESLSTKAKGRAWVFVTSQEDMESIIGDQTAKQSQDFSKIQGRFATRVKLNSQDVLEVINKRLLSKNLAGANALGEIYAQQSANFKTLFGFVDGARTYKNYDSETLFVETYPLVSYQVPLLQQGMIELSAHNAFEGRSKSVGERSMLSVVQEVAKALGATEVGSLVTFDQMFEGIRSSLKSAPQVQIQVAEKNLSNPLAVRLLKALFLVKYVTGFPATVRNLSVLVYDRFGSDISQLQKDVADALATLEQGTYVHRTGETYSYLTNEEQDIEKEIKNVEVDSSDVGERLFSLLHSSVMKGVNKWRYAKTNQDLPLGFMLDDVAKSPAKDLTLHFISPANPNSADNIRLQGAGKAELRVLLEADPRLLPDLGLLLKTTKYVKQKQGTALTDSVKRVLEQKSQETIAREKELTERIKDAVVKATLVHDTVEVPSSSAAAEGRIADGMNVLIQKSYPQLDLLGGKSFPESDISKYTQTDDGSLAGVGGPLEVPALEVYSMGVLAKDKLGEQVTVKKLIDQFQARPYGWDYGSILCVIASLFGQGKITVDLDNVGLKRTEVNQYLASNAKQASLVIRKQATFDASKVKAFSEFVKEFFDQANPPKDPTELAQQGSDRLKAKLEQLKTIVGTSRYPFTSALQPAIGHLEAVVNKPPTWYLTEFAGGDELIDVKNDVIVPIDQFINGAQAKTYDEAQRFFAASAGNLLYLIDHAVAEAEALLVDPTIFRGNKANQLKTAVDNVRTQLDGLVKEERTKADAKIRTSREQIEGSDHFAAASEDARREVLAEVDHHLLVLDHQTGIAELRLAPTRFQSEILPKLMAQLTKTDPGPGPTPPTTQFVPLNQIVVSGGKQVLAAEGDVDDYVDSLRAALKAAIQDGKQILR